MHTYDVVHVDDSEMDRTLMGRKVGKESWSYHGISNLASLEEGLTTQLSARAFIIDGKFFDREGGTLSLLAPAAVAVIRRYQPTAHLLLYSGEIDIADIANELDIDYLAKSGRGPGLVIEKLKKKGM